MVGATPCPAGFMLLVLVHGAEVPLWHPPGKGFSFPVEVWEALGVSSCRVHARGLQESFGLDLSARQAGSSSCLQGCPLGRESLARLVLGSRLWACFLVDLLALLKWKAFPDRIMDVLGRLRHVSGEEIVKVRLPAILTCRRAGGGALGLTSPPPLPVTTS